jgi:hypothetical protein
MVMSNEEKKETTTEPKPKKVAEGQPSELDDESLEGVSGGMLGVAIPNVGGVTGLPNEEMAICISQ